MNTAVSELYWRSGQKEQPLAACLEELVQQLGGEPDFSYLEWRPGNALLHPQATPPAALIAGRKPHDAAIALDEVHLFANTGGLHAIEDAGVTRWMQWQLQEPQASTNWETRAYNESRYDILILNSESARRFGLHEHRLPPQHQYEIVEYRHKGSLFCWNLLKKEKSVHD